MMEKRENVWQRLESLRVPDAVIAQAYESAGARARSLFKQEIAAAHAVFSQALPSLGEDALARWPGLEIRRRRRPVDWALVALDVSSLCAPEGGTGGGREHARHRLASPAVLAAVSAVFAGVRNIGVLLAGESIPQGTSGSAGPDAGEALLAGLELGGIENVCAAGPQALAEIFDLLAAETSGRILILGRPAWRLKALALADAGRDVGTWCAGEGRKGAEGIPGGWKTLWPLLPVSFFMREDVAWRESGREEGCGLLPGSAE